MREIESAMRKFSYSPHDTDKKIRYKLGNIFSRIIAKISSKSYKKCVAELSVMIKDGKGGSDSVHESSPAASRVQVFQGTNDALLGKFNSPARMIMFDTEYHVSSCKWARCRGSRTTSSTVHVDRVRQTHRFPGKKR